MSRNLELAVRIEALVKGVEEVQRLAGEVGELTDAGREQIPDNTEELRDGAQQTTDSLESLNGSIGRVVVAAGGLAAIAAYLKSSARESMDADTRFRVLQQAVENTGAAAGHSAEEIRELSSELALATLGTREGFERAATQLLSFQSVAGEAFSQTLELAQDLAQSGFGSLENNARMLGRALEDPARGLDLLRRSGVVFSQEQEDLIRSLQETGRHAEAQAVILEAVSARVGGAGRAAAEGLEGAFDTLSQRFEELRQATGDAIEPALTAFYESLADALVWVAENMDAVMRVAQVLGATLLAVGARRVLASLAGVTAQLVAMGGAAGGAAASTRLLAAAMRTLPLVGTAALITQLVPLLLEWRREARATAEASELLAESEGRLQERLEEISVATGVAVSSMQEFEQAVESGRLVWDEQAARWLSAEQAAHKLAQAQDEAARAAREYVSALPNDALREQAEEMVSAGLAAVRLAEDLREIAEAGEDVDAAIDDLIGRLDLADSTDLGNLVASIELLRGESDALADAVEGRLLESLRALTDTELTRFGQGLADAFERGRIGAETFARVNDQVMTESLRRLGLTAEQVFGDIPDAAEQAADALQAFAQGLSNSTLDAEERTRALDRALTQAFTRVETADGLRHLRERIMSLGEAGLLTGEQVTGALRDIDAQIRELGGSAQLARAALTQMLDGVDTSESIAELQRLKGVLHDAWAGGRISTDEYREAVERLDARIDALGDTAQEAGKKAKAAMQEAEAAAREAGDAAQNVSAGSAEAAAHMGAWFAGHLDNARGMVRELGDAAEAAWAQMTGQPVEQAAQDIKGLEAALAGAREEYDRFHDGLNLGRTFNEWANGLYRAASDIKVQFYEQRLEAERTIQALEEMGETGQASAAKITQATRLANDQLDLLDDQTLSRLHAAIDGARSRMDTLRDSARGTLESLQEELLRLQGREDELARQRMARREADLRAQLAEARAAGDQQSIADLERALRTLEQIGREEAKQRREKDKERKESERHAQRTRAADQDERGRARTPEAERAQATPPPAPRPSRTVRIEVGGAHIDAPDTQAEKFLHALEREGLRTAR